MAHSLYFLDKVPSSRGKIKWGFAWEPAPSPTQINPHTHTHTWTQPHAIYFCCSFPMPFYTFSMFSLEHFLCIFLRSHTLTMLIEQINWWYMYHEYINKYATAQKHIIIHHYDYIVNIYLQFTSFTMECVFIRPNWAVHFDGSSFLCKNEDRKSTSNDHSKLKLLFLAQIAYKIQLNFE